MHFTQKWVDVLERLVQSKSMLKSCAWYQHNKIRVKRPAASDVSEWLLLKKFYHFPNFSSQFTVSWTDGGKPALQMLPLIPF